MRINIGSLKGQPGFSQRETRQLSQDIIASDLPANVEVCSPIDVDLVVTNTGKGLLITGKLVSDVQYECTRCLREFPGKLEADVEEFYRTAHEGMELEEDDDFFPEEIPVVDGDEIDLTDALRESLLLAVPMKVVCQEDCPGLCPQCGQPLKDGACDCAGPDIDLRFAPLLELLKAEDKTEERGKEDGSTKEKKLQSKD